MIHLFTGVPGSGKTYRMVHDLLKLPDGKYFVFHNIDGLKEELIERGEYIQAWAEIPEFLTRAKQQALSDQIRKDHGRQMLVIIDEAWEFLGRKSRQEPEALAWLKMHRHMDQQVWICTQSFKDLSQAVYDVVPFEIRAKRGIIGSQYIYQHNVRGESYKTERIPKKKAVYHAYTSFQGTGEKVKTTRILPIALVLLAIFIWAAYYSFTGGIQGTFTPEAQAAVKKEAPAKQIKTVAPAKTVTPAATPPPRPEPLQEYSFAGCAGTSWWVQEVNGGKLLKGNERYPEFVVTDCQRGLVVLTSGKTGVVRLSARKKINIPDAPAGEAMPPAGSQAGGPGPT